MTDAESSEPTPEPSQETADLQEGATDPEPADRADGVPTLAARRAEAMRQLGLPGAEAAAKIEEQTKGYREVTEKLLRSVQPAVDMQEQISRAMPKIDTSALMPKIDLGLNRPLESLRPIEPPLPLTRHFEEMQERLAADREVWEREQAELDAETEAAARAQAELEAARHDAMLSALTATAGHLEVLVEEQRSEHWMLVGTFLLAYLGVAAAVLVPAWSSLSLLGQVLCCAVVAVGALLLAWWFGRRPRKRYPVSAGD